MEIRLLETLNEHFFSCIEIEELKFLFAFESMKVCSMKLWYFANIKFERNADRSIGQ